MIQVTRWSPDTCGCVMEYEWDDQASEEERTHSFTKLVEKCPEHAGITKHEDVHDHVLAENQTKNAVLGAVLEAAPRLIEETTNPRGEVVTQLTSDVDYKWTFTGEDKDRELKVELVNADLSKTETKKLGQAISKLEKPVVLE